jgi:hypothetical protein
MSHTRNTEKIVQHSKSNSERLKNLVFQAIQQMEKGNEFISFATVAKKVGVSKSFLYDHKDIRVIIQNHIDKGFQTVAKSENEKEIERLRKVIREIKTENKNYKKDTELRERYEKLFVENKELRKQLEVAYLHYQ